MIWPVTVSVEILTLWMIALTVKHVVADFLLQTSWMALGKERATGWLAPLLAHTATHAVILLLMLLVAAPRYWWVAIVDFVVHTIIDRGKGLVTSRFNLTPETNYFWWAIGIDQALHHLTGFVFAVMLAAR